MTSVRLFEVIDDDGNEQPLQGPLRPGVIYRGGNASAGQSAGSAVIDEARRCTGPAAARAR